MIYTHAANRGDKDGRSQMVSLQDGGHRRVGEKSYRTRTYTAEHDTAARYCRSDLHRCRADGILPQLVKGGIYRDHAIADSAPLTNAHAG
jgi:hypothetical protein